MAPISQREIPNITNTLTLPWSQTADGDLNPCVPKRGTTTRPGRQATDGDLNPCTPKVGKSPKAQPNTTRTYPC